MNERHAVRPSPNLFPRPSLAAVKTVKPGGVAPIPERPVVMLVTPAMAADWLENRNVHNRTKSKVTANRYAKAIRADRWKCTHQGVAFDRDGFLIDGQHRLLAVVATGIGVKLFVIPFVEGMDDDTFGVLDSGSRRQAAQMLGFKGAAAAAAAARILGVIDGSFDEDTHVTGGVYATNAETDEVLDVVDLWPELPYLTTQTSAAYKNARIPQSLHLAVLAQASRSRHSGHVDSWLEGLNKGVGLGPGDPRLLARNRFTRDERAFNDGIGKALGYRLLVKAWNAHALGKSLGVLKASVNEDVPEVLK